MQVMALVAELYIIFIPVKILIKTGLYLPLQEALQIQNFINSNHQCILVQTGTL
jgi:hypothetical protein